MNDHRQDLEHSWYERHFAAFATGLLAETDEKRFADHLAECEACQQWRDAHIDAFGGANDGGTVSATDTELHLPPAMIARWDRARDTLRGAERIAVRRHLERCGTCREELALSGHEPVLSEATIAQLRPTTAPPSASDDQHAPSRTRSRRWQPWIVGSAGLMVAAVALLVLIPGRTEPPDPSSAYRGGVVPWIAPVQLRGAAGEPLVIEPQTRSVGLIVSVPAEFDLARAAELTVLTAGNSVILTTSVAPAELTRRSLFVLLQTDYPLPAGEYRVVLRQATSDGSLEETTRFALRSDGP